MTRSTSRALPPDEPPSRVARRRPTWLLWAALVAFAACLALGVIVVAGIFAPLDHAANDAGARVRGMVVGDLLHVWQTLGELGPFLILIWLPAVLMFLVRRRTAALWLALGIVPSLLSSGAKLLFATSRPPGGEVVDTLGERSFAFPSGHTTRTLVALGLLALLLYRELPASRRPSRAVLWLVVIAGTTGMAAARVVSGQHWLSDVTGGALIGAAWMALTAWLWRPASDAAVTASGGDGTVVTAEAPP